MSRLDEVYKEIGYLEDELVSVQETALVILEELSRLQNEADGLEDSGNYDEEEE